MSTTSGNDDEERDRLAAQMRPVAATRRRTLLRRSDQPAVALSLLVAIVVLGIGWVRSGGPAGHLREFDDATAAMRAVQPVEYIVDLNTAGTAELGELPQVGPTLARRLIEHREQNGPFHSSDDLLKVKGIGPKTLEALRPHVRFR